MCSGGALNIMNKRAMSAPYSSTSSCGSTPLFFDFDIVPMPSSFDRSPSALISTAPMRSHLLHQTCTSMSAGLKY